MTGIGKTLRQAREEQELSLEEVENKIKIRKRYLEALEAEDFGIFPGNIYMFGFLRNYAIFLNLNGEELVELLKTNFDEDEEDLKPQKALFEYNHFNKKSYNFPKLLKRLLILILVVLAGIYLFYYFTKEPINEIIMPIDEIEEIIEGNDIDNDQNTEAIVEETVKENVRLMLMISREKGAKCWVEVKTDGETSFSGILESGENKYFEANENIKIRLGNAGVVSLIYNDENIGLAGPMNKVIDLEFPQKSSDE